jgi:RimJ/RimL family protein N-acetyltransferase
MSLVRVIPDQAGEGVGRLIPLDTPTRPRATAVLDGVLSGYLWVDDADDPNAVLVIEDADGTVYGGGELTREMVAEALAGIETASAELVFGFSGSRDPLRGLVPVEPFWSGEAIDFTDRHPPAEEAAELDVQLADGARAVPLDASLLPRIEWYEDTLHAFGSVERWLELALGYGVLVDGELVAEALAGPRTRAGQMEMGVITREAHRRRGFGTLVSRLTARACEARGDTVWWNANAGNTPSLAIARRLGFRRERRYELVACHAPIGSTATQR